MSSFRRAPALATGSVSFALAAACLPQTGFSQPVVPVRRQEKPATSASRQQEMDALFQEGSKANAAKDFPAALKAWQNGLERAEALKDSVQIARFLCAVGVAYANSEQHEKAIDFYTRALVLWEANGNKQDSALVLNNLGNNCQALDQPEKAIGYYNRALALRETLGNPTSIAGTLNNLGDVYRSCGDYEKALDFYQRTLVMRETLGNKQDVARILNNLNTLQYALDQFSHALVVAGRTPVIPAPVGNKKEIADTLRDMGVAYNSSGQAEKALPCYQRAFLLYSAIDNKQDIARTLTNSGNVYAASGQYEKALSYYNQALEIREALGSKPEIADTFNAMGDTCCSSAAYEKALEFHHRALAIQEALGRKQAIAHSLHHLGDVHCSSGDYKKALDFYQRSLAIRETLGNKRDLAATLLQVGHVQHFLNHSDQALALCNRALEIQEVADNQREIATTLDDMGVLYGSAGQPEKALASYTRALKIQETLGSRQESAGTLSALGSLYQKQGQLDKAEEAFARSLRNLEDGSGELAADTQPGTLEDALPHVYERYARLLIQLRKPDDALAAVEHGRRQFLVRQLDLQDKTFFRGFTPEERQSLEAAHTHFVVATRERRVTQDKLAFSSDSNRPFFRQRSKEAEAKWREAEGAYVQRRDALIARYPQFRQICGQQPLRMADFKALAHNHPDTLTLEYAVVDGDTTLLFVLDPDGHVEALTLPVGAKSLSEQIQRWRQAIARTGSKGEGAPLATPAEQAGAQEEETKAAVSLYTALLGSVTQLQQSREKTHGNGAASYSHLYVVSNGPLLNLPFAALMDGQGRRLMQRFALSSMVGLGIFPWRSSPRSAASRFYCVADTKGTLEGQTLARLFSKPGLRIGSQAREADVKRDLPNYAILHCAVRGVLDDQNSLRSGLSLSPEPADSPEDGILEAQELLNLPLSAQMAVLSGCDTRQGQQKGGEGLLGLAWAFQAAGVPSVVANQWSVDDEATRLLMLTFYQELLKGKAKDVALQAAMKAVQAKKPQPYYWAAFQVIGDTAPLTR